MAGIFDAYVLKDMTLKNRIMMSPMCQYAVWAQDGAPNAWHVVHYIARAVGGAGLVMMEMTDVVPNGRITVQDLGIWADSHIDAYRRIVDQVHDYGAKIGIQIAHAGRKTQSADLEPEAPSAIPFSDRYRVPRALTVSDIHKLIDAFHQGARRAVAAGVDTLELHGAHGYLINQFMSPLANQRDDEYGEPTRFGVDVIEAVKSAMPSGMPLLIRLSATEYAEMGYDFPQLIEMAGVFYRHGVDMFDVSTGGNARVKVHEYPGHQAPYAAQLKRALGAPVIAVGRLESFELAASLIEQGQADVVAIGRGMLQNPYWTNAAAEHFDGVVQVPKQYYLAFPKRFTRGGLQ